MKRFLSSFLLCGLCLGLAASVSAAPFTDVPSTHWAQTYIQRSADSGWTLGVGDGRFHPAGTVTGSEFVTMLVRALFPEEAAKAAGAEPPAWWEPYLQAAQSLGLFAGTDLSANSVSAAAHLPRGQMAVLMANAMQARGFDTALTAAQADQAAGLVSDWEEVGVRLHPAAAYCLYSGLLLGKDDGRFAAEDTLTRAEAAAVLCRLYDAAQATEEEAPSEPGGGDTLANGQAITEENVRAILYGLQSTYPEGMGWTNADFYQSSALRWGGYGCEGFALICSDAVFGALPIRAIHSNFDEIRAGDMIRVSNNTHTVVVLEKKADSIVVTEGNYNSSIHWGRELTRQELAVGNFSVRTRYP